MGSIPTLASLDTRTALHDKEWRFHILPSENVEIPRRHVPDPEAEAVPTVKHESAAELERRWLDGGIDRIEISGRPPRQAQPRTN